MNINLKHLYLLYTTFLSKILLFLKNILKIKSPLAKGQRAENVLAPLMFASWNQIIKDMRNIYKLKELISLPVSVINPI